MHPLLEMLQNLAQSELYLDPAAAAGDVASRFSAIYQSERGQLNAKRELTRRPLRPYLLHLPLTIDLREWHLENLPPHKLLLCEV